MKKKILILFLALFVVVLSACDLTISQSKTYTVTFDSNGGSEVPSQKVKENERAYKPDDPIKDRSKFEGWFLNDELYDFTSEVKNDIVLKAMWTDIHYNIYNVTFLDYDDKVLSKQEVEEGQNATPPSDPTRFGYIFVGWDISYEKINSDREIHAVYEIDKSKEYTISYNLNGGQWDYQTKTEYINDFLKDFYSFIAPRESLSVFMHGEGNTVGFLGTWRNYIGLSSVSGSVNHLIYLNNPTIENDDYFFNSSRYQEKWLPLAEWVNSLNGRFASGNSDYYGACIDFDRYIRDDADKYESVYGENFHLFPRSSNEVINKYKPSNKDILLPIPSLPGKRFLGWSFNSDLSGEPTDKIVAGTVGNLELYAEWSDIVTYEIVFDTDGGNDLPNIVVEYGDVVDLPTPVKSGTYFVCWLLNGKEVPSHFTFNVYDSIVLVAKWGDNIEDLVYSGNKVTNRNGEVVQIPKYYEQPESDFRATWVSAYIDDFIPSTNQNTMKANLTAVLDNLESYHMNAIIFHLRPTNNAYYQTKLAPIDQRFGNYNTFDEWDYLTWFIEECHKRDIEFHAWLNPYRIKAYGYSKDATPSDVAKDYINFPNNPASDPTNILMTYREDGTKGAILNPAKQSVRDYIVQVCLELAQNYDIDAIHFDDYFYAQMSSGITVLTEPDQQDYENYINNNPTSNYSKTSAENKKSWRRDQINLFIESLSNSLSSFNEENNRSVQLGISPTGIYRNGNGVVTYDNNGNAITNGSVTAGQEHYSSYLFCDSKKWIDEEWIDYIIPQTYWGFTHRTADYADVVDWWAKVVKNKKVNLYTGMGLYMSSDYTSGTYSWLEQPYESSNQVLYNTKYPEVKGISIFSYKTMVNVNNNPSSIQYQGMMRIKTDYWKDKVPTPKTKSYKE